MSPLSWLKEKASVPRWVLLLAIVLVLSSFTLAWGRAHRLHNTGDAAGYRLEECRYQLEKGGRLIIDALNAPFLRTITDFSDMSLAALACLGAVGVLGWGMRKKRSSE